MPNDLSELARAAAAGALVVAVALPAALVARALRPKGEPLLPRWKPFPVPWGGFEVTIAFIAISFVVPLVALEVLNESGFYQIVYGDDFPLPKAEGIGPERKFEAGTLRMLWANLFALPIALGALALTRYSFYPKWHPKPNGSVAGKVALAVVAWAVLTPVVLLLHVVVNAVSQQLDVPPDTHSLAKLGPRPLRDQILLALEACVGAPLREEILFRGLLLWWCVGRIKFPGAGVSPVTSLRPWFVMCAATAYTATGGRWQPVAFACVLVVGLGVLWRFTHTGARRARAVYATAAFFALHHAVWPNPVPLFVLGLGLGWLAVRTNGLLVPVLVHGLFNAVAVVIVLRGG